MTQFEDCPKSHILFVANLSPSTTHDEIFKMFSAYGEIQSIYLNGDGKRMGIIFAFVQFYDMRDAYDAFNALQNTKFKDRFLRIEYRVGGINQGTKAVDESEGVSRMHQEDEQVDRLNNQYSIKNQPRRGQRENERQRQTQRLRQSQREKQLQKQREQQREQRQLNKQKQREKDREKQQREREMERLIPRQKEKQREKEWELGRHIEKNRERQSEREKEKERVKTDYERRLEDKIFYLEQKVSSFERRLARLEGR